MKSEKSSISSEFDRVSVAAEMAPRDLGTAIEVLLAAGYDFMGSKAAAAAGFADAVARWLRAGV